VEYPETRKVNQTWTMHMVSSGYWAFALRNRSLCLTAGDGTHPDLQLCDPTYEAQWWSFGNYEAGSIVRSAVGGCLQVSSQDGAGCKADQFMMGDDYMAAPVLGLGQRSRAVYFPKGANWQHHFTGKLYNGGTTTTVDAPIDNFPLFKRIADTATIAPHHRNLNYSSTWPGL